MIGPVKVLNFVFLASVLLGYGLGSTPTRAAELSLVGGANWSTVQPTKFTSIEGVLFAFDLPAKLQLEVGLLFHRRLFSYSDGGGNSFQENYPCYDLPVLIRIPVGTRFSLGIGGYYTTPTGNDEHSVTYVNKVGAHISTVPASQYLTSEYGAVVSGKYSIPIGKKTSLFLDARYSHGFSDASANSAVSFYFRDVQMLAGFSYRF